MEILAILTSAAFLEKVLPPLITALVGWAVKAYLSKKDVGTSRSAVIGIEQWPDSVETMFKLGAKEILARDYNLNTSEGKQAIEKALQDLVTQARSAVKASVQQTSQELDVEDAVRKQVDTILEAYKAVVADRKSIADQKTAVPGGTT